MLDKADSALDTTSPAPDKADGATVLPWRQRSQRRAKRLRRVLHDLDHGGHAVSAEVTADPGTSPSRQLSVAEVTGADEPQDIAEISTPFGYMFPDLRDAYPNAHLPAESAGAVVAGLKALGTAMVDQPGDPAGADSTTIAPIYTYWGQFVDHDLTANTDRDKVISIEELPLTPLTPTKVLQDLRNLREPALNLDSVYGNGPGPHSAQIDQVPFDGDRFVIGDLEDQDVPLDPLTGFDLPRCGDFDLPTDGAKRAPRIGDGRNDENLVVAQLHLSFLKFHNAVVDWVAANPGTPAAGDGSFDRVRQLVEWHYQWVTVHDFLKTIAMPSVVDDVLANPGSAVFKPENAPETFMPLEFSVAAYRFGHSMVRASYDWNANFGIPGTRSARAGFGLLFLFTGKGGFAGPLTLPNNWPAQFERLTGAEPRPADAPAAAPVRFARKIDTRLAPPLADLANEGTEPGLSEQIKRLLRRLAVRNLVRGYRLALPTGQAVATALGVAPLTKAQLLSGGSQVLNDALIDGGFLIDTPLWFYILKEAELAELGGGEHLGPVGSRIVVETILGQLRAQGTSFVNAGWTPADGVPAADGGQVDTIIRFLQFAGMHP